MVEQNIEALRMFQREIGDSVEALWSMETSKILYHFTSAKSFQEAVESRCLFATDLRYLNDASEAVYVADVLGRVGQRLRERAKTIVAERFIETLTNEAWLQQAVSPNGDSGIYVTSFSAKRDLLSQWRAYGGDGLGYAIGIDVGQLVAPDGLTVRLLQCRYNAQVQETMVDSHVGLILGELNEHEADDSSGKQLLEFAFTTVKKLSALGVAMKMPGFEEEDEWRLVVIADDVADHAAKLSFRPSSFGLTPFLKLFARHELPLPIRTLVMGPKLNSKEAQRSTEQFLRRNGYRVEVSAEVSGMDAKAAPERDYGSRAAVVVARSKTSYR